MKVNQGAEKNIIAAGANACIASCQKLSAQIEPAKANLLVELQGTLELPKRLFRLAVGEAEALARQTGYPHLDFPALAIGKVQAAADGNGRHHLIRQKKSVHAMSN